MSNWKKKDFEISVVHKDGRTELKQAWGGEVCHLFGWHWDDAGFVLSHLKTGLRVAALLDAESAKRIGDYLSENYADDFARLNAEYRRSMTFEQYKALPSAIDLNGKMKRDKTFAAMIEELKYAGAKRR